MKKFLSMVLALAMAMSLVTFAAPAAGAKDFTDNSSIQYKEAVDVISAIQIMDGYADASFNPSGTLTRGAAAKIICNMILGPTTAAALPTNVAPFPDVPAGSTFAGYIAYCSEHAIISGYADGNFRPADSLSGYAFLKMLLCALGYDQEIEGYQGANWRVNVAKQALGIGLDDDLNGELDGSRIVTREEAALYAFNTLQADMVEYDSKTTVSVNGATVSVGGNKYQSRVWSTQKTGNNNISGATQNGIVGAPDIVQFAEEYFPNLVRRPVKENAFAGGNGKFGEPVTTWTWKGVEVGKYSYKLAKSYYGDVKVSDIYADLGLAGSTNPANVYLNGVLMFRLPIERANDDKLHEQTLAGALTYMDPTLYNGKNDAAGTAPALNAVQYYDDKVGDGTIIEVYYNEDSNDVVICAKSVYPGQINSVNSATKTKDAYVVVDYKGIEPAVYGGGNYPVANYARDDHDEFETELASTFAEDDMVWFTYSEKPGDRGIGEVNKMEAVEGTLDRRVQGKSATLNGTSYKYGEEIGYDWGNTDNTMTYNSSYVVYMDAAGNVLFIEESEFAADQYALIERISVENANNSDVYYSALNAAGLTTVSNNPSSWDTNMVRLLTSNGTVRTVDLDGSNRYLDNTKTVAANGTMIADSFLAGSIVRYAQQDDGSYKLYSISGGGSQARSAHNGLGEAAQFVINNHRMTDLYSYAPNTPYTPTVVGTETRLVRPLGAAGVTADSDTVFVIKDGDTYKVYSGLRNAPNVLAGGTNPWAQAYAYCTGANPKAKIVFIIRGVTQTTSKDITFLAGASRSDLYVEGDTVPYFEVISTVKGQMETLAVARDKNGRAANGDNILQARFANGAVSYQINLRDGDEAWNSIILNSTSYDSDDIMTDGWYSNNSVDALRAVGIKRTGHTDEVEVGTYENATTGNVLRVTGSVSGPINIPNFQPGYGGVQQLADNCNIYYVNGDGESSMISLSEIHNDKDDIVYYTMDDGEITNLYICDFEE